MGIGSRKQTDVAPPGFNLKPGDIACTLGINQTKGQSANAFFLIDCRKEPIIAATFKLTKVENPQNQDIIIGDGLDWNPNTLTITVSRGGKQTMILRFAR